MRSLLPFVIGALVLVGGLVALVLVSRRATREFEKSLRARDFVPTDDCPTVAVAGEPLVDQRCYRGPVAPGWPATVVVGFVRAPSRRGTFTRYLGVQLAASPALDDAWLARWQGRVASAQRLSDGRVVLVWPLLDTPANLERVIDEVAGALPR